MPIMSIIFSSPSRGVSAMLDPKNFKRNGVLAAFAGVFAFACANATIVNPGASVTVTQTWAYTAYSGGDFVFSTTGITPGCASGWYISSTDPGFKSAVATVLTAQAGGNYVWVYGDNSQIWSGSPSGQYCHLQTIGITS
jgi:hypothetical protein